MSRIEHGGTPEYRGTSWIAGRLPVETEAWPKFGTRRLIEATNDDYDISRDEVREYARGKPWVWPESPVYFFCDIHADTDAFFTSLAMSGGVEKTGPNDDDFDLTEAGRQARFVIGGDCFDKGPHNLRLLRVLHSLREKGARLELLAGNHDVRAAVGFRYAGSREPLLSHLFVRMGKKSVPLFREIWDAYLADNTDPATLWTEAEVREKWFPPESWYEEFPEAIRGIIPDKKIHKEVRRIREKTVELVEQCAVDGMTLGMVHAACEKGRELFLDPDGEYAWYFGEMQLARRAGSFLFVHAGVDDDIAAVLRAEGIDVLNSEFRRLMDEDLFTLYHGPVGNAFRTKYRDFDLPLTGTGVGDLFRAGVYAIVHGHRNILRGQRIVMREGLLNFECDASVDTNTRKVEGLQGSGGAVVVIDPSGRILGLSTDYQYVKVLDAARVFELMAIV